MAELNDWTCEYNGLVMGEPDSAVSIVAVDGLLTLPEIRSSDLTLVQRHGLYAGDDYMNGRTVTVTLEVYGSTREEFTQALVNLRSCPGTLRSLFASGSRAWLPIRPGTSWRVHGSGARPLI
jgi:hypothetical protein